jgi:hypothetical protein
MVDHIISAFNASTDKPFSYASVRRQKGLNRNCQFLLMSLLKGVSRHDPRFLYKAFDIALVVGLVVFFVGYVNIHAGIFGISHFLPTSEEIEQFWDAFSWALFAMLVFDMVIKYKKAGNLQSFLKKYWLELLMLAMIPIFAGFKIAKISVNLIKALKMTKSGFKAAHGVKKISKKPNE